MTELNKVSSDDSNNSSIVPKYDGKKTIARCPV